MYLCIYACMYVRMYVCMYECIHAGQLIDYRLFRTIPYTDRVSVDLSSTTPPELLQETVERFLEGAFATEIEIHFRS